MRESRTSGSLEGRILQKVRLLDPGTKYLIHYIVFWKVAQYNINIVIYIVASISITAVLSMLSYQYVEQKLVGWILKKLT